MITLVAIKNNNNDNSAKYKQPSQKEDFHPGFKKNATAYSAKEIYNYILDSKLQIKGKSNMLGYRLF